MTDAAEATTSATLTQTGAPVPPTSRIHAIDAARGFALLGIFCVNILLFAEPFGAMVNPDPPGSALDKAAHYFVTTFCTMKFYGLFSLLFGIGFMLQRSRLMERGLAWKRIYARRLVFLGVLGLVHAWLLWYGDILLMYAVVAVVLMACAKAAPRTLVISAAALYLIAVLMSASCLGLSAMGGAQGVGQGGTRPPTAATQPETSAPEPQAPPANPSGDAAPRADEPEKFKEPFWSTPFGELIRGFKTQTVQDPSSEIWMNTERRAYQEGPYSQVFMFRGFTWIMMIVWSTFTGFILTIVAMFLLGAALVKSDAFSPQRRPLHRRLLMAGALVGLPMCAAAAFLATKESMPRMLVATVLQTLGAPLMSLGYLAGVTMLVHAGRAPWLMERLALTGRMALTNYLLQTVVATTLFYYYGFGLFGTVPQAGLLAIVAAVYSVQLLVISPLWLSRFRFGPMEWLWRTVTYWRAQPMARGAGGLE